MSINTLAQQYIETLQTNPNVLGIILFGSWARGNNRVDSDIDLLVIVQAGFKRTVETSRGHTFEITCTTEQGALDFWQSNPDDAVELWRIAQVLFDRDGTVARLQQAGHMITVQGKPPLMVDQYAHATFDAHDRLRAVEQLATADPTTAKMLLANKVSELTALFFDVRQCWTPPPKQRLVAIKELNQNLYNFIARFYDERSIIEQIDIAKSIIASVFEA